MLSKHDYIVLSGIIVVASVIIKQTIEIYDLKATSKVSNGTIIKLMRVNLYYADKMDKNGVSMTEFDKIAVNDLMN